ncbi:molybdopterin molybdotransferase MoeA [Marinobacter zhejiangensis]|uniref:Molybdopterin molybdenumtransferase n=1 Tax=Marinobacter zhejiangensis TaxID=488535 RepID=A0A1I4MDU0_9GAMM|nr:gephyrin-like molybdotransferase Glp [Marinobacter zhejiangensis]SFM01107.1 molybdopterin molybdochelatase [Marinobacter zhejiangensis]
MSHHADLTSVDDALTHLLAQATPLAQIETVALTGALGRILAEDITVPLDVPPADNSAVDGYALRFEDLTPGATIPVSERIPAGHAPQPLTPGTAARIFTGSEVPAGADLVVMQERVEVAPDGIRISGEHTPGQNIRRRGQDLAKGGLALARGARLRPQELGLLASIGIAEVPVLRRFRVAVLTTGDELVDPGQPLAAGQIYNSNRFTLLGLLERAGCEVVLCENLRDERSATIETLHSAADVADLVITSGGVSVGEEDHVRAVLESQGKLSLWRLAIKPGKPLAFGHLGKTPVIGLPGNPAAVLVTFLVVALPFIRRCQGQDGRSPQGQRLAAAFAIDKPSIRREFVRARKEIVDGEARVTAYPNQSSGMLSSACWADGLAIIPEHAVVSPGDTITYYSFNDLMG